MEYAKNRNRLSKTIAKTLGHLSSRTWRTEVTYPVFEMVDLPEVWDGVRIAIISDLHLGWFVQVTHFNKVVMATNDAKPDIIVIAGDVVSKGVSLNSELGDSLKELNAPEGKLAVLGNHDHCVGAEKMTEILETAGISMLTNKHRVLRRDGQRICFGGVDDLLRGNSSCPLERIFDGVDQSVPRILLCHNPDYAQQIPPHPRVDLMICGHTHGGQVKLPLLGPLIVPVNHRKHVEGFSHGPHCTVFTSRGLGVVGVPFRFRCPAEIPILTLRSKPRSQQAEA